ncbi:Vmc-like lipoprotein signal peptide domain-containing protein [Mycoplasmopsis cynos]|uniref:Vmc-like lipoprotein signal peptide domain-containing protein n=1 Tax=Mycoplasmopsis cynos TaxID=171284 RepID=UPI0030D21BBE
MNKYKKIFSGLGLLSISTLIGASVVACANKKPKPSDSSTEGIDQNNNQGNSTTPEQGKPEMPQNPAPGTDHNNQGKNEDSTGKDNNGKTELEKDKKPEKTPEQGQNDKQEENKDESDKSDSNQNKKENEQTPHMVDIEEKSKSLEARINVIKYPDNNAKAKTKLKEMIKTIRSKNNTNDEQKLQELILLEKSIEQINKELEKVIKQIDELPYPTKYKNGKEITLVKGSEESAKEKFKKKLNDKITVDEIVNVLPKDWKTKIESYNKIFDEIEIFTNTDNLKKGFVQTDDSIGDGRTESLLIYNIYETVRPKFISKIKELKINNPDEYTKKFETIENKNKQNHKKDLAWLSGKIKAINEEYKKAQEAKKLQENHKN